MTSSFETYRVVDPAGVVIEDAGSSILYSPGAVFECRPRCPSVVRHLRSRRIVSAESLEEAIAPLATGPSSREVGPTGEPGPVGKRGRPGDRGLKGDVGDEGPAGPRGLNWRGSWASSVTYEVDDAVCHLGSSFVAILPNRGDPPFSINWSVLSSRGGDGFEGRTDAAGLTDKWLAIKARLEALPDRVERDPYKIARNRLEVAVNRALSAMKAAGGPA